METYGIDIPASVLPAMDRVRVLEYFEGPLLVEFRSRSSNELYLYSWCDVDDEAHRWIVLRTIDREVSSYLKGVSTLRELILSARDGAVFLVDINGDGAVRRTRYLPLADLPESYLPAEDSLIDPENAVMDEGSPWRILLDGHWGLTDLGGFPRHYRDVYNTLYLFGVDQPRAPETLRLGEHIEHTRGAGVNNLWAHIDGTIPTSDRLRFRGIQLESPGVLTLELSQATAREVRSSVRREVGVVGEKGRRLQRKTVYDALYAEKHRRPVEDISDQRLDDLGRKLTPLLGLSWDAVAHVFRNTFQRADFLLAYQRKLEKLEDYLDSGKVSAL